MTHEIPVSESQLKDHYREALCWLAAVLVGFAKAEQAIGRLCVQLNLPIKNGPLGSVNDLRCRLSQSEDRRCRNLQNRIARWQSLRPVRHLLAHATLQILYDDKCRPVVVTRQLPLNENDVTPDRVWTEFERHDLLRIANNDGRSIHDQVNNLLADLEVMKKLRKS